MLLPPPAAAAAAANSKRPRAERAVPLETSNVLPELQASFLFLRVLICPLED